MRQLLIILITLALLGSLAVSPGYAFNVPKDSGHNTAQNPDTPKDTPPEEPKRDDDGDPVDLEAGNFQYSFLDAGVMGSGLRLRFMRSYHSQNRYEGPLGYGWHHNYDIRLYRVYEYPFLPIGVASSTGTEQPSQQTTSVFKAIIVRYGDGVRLRFNLPEQSGAPFKSPIGRYLSLVQDGDDYVMRNKHGRAWTFEPDPSGATWRLARVADSNGNLISLTYDPQSRLIRLSDDTGRQINLAYDDDNRIASVTDPAGRVSSYVYDGDGDQVRYTDPDGNPIRYGYDTRHALLTITDQRGNVRLSNTYDDQRRVISQNTGGGTYTFSYDDANHRATVTRPDGGRWVYQFNEHGLTTHMTDPYSKVVTQTWDADLNLISRTGPLGQTTTFEYDDMGNVVRMTDALGRVTRHNYDPVYNELTRIQWPDSSVRAFTRDARGNLTRFTDEAGNATVYTRTAAGHIATITDATGAVSAFTYDTHHYVSAVVDPLGNRTDMSHNVVGRLLAVQMPGDVTHTFTYDGRNNPLTVTNSLGQTRRLTWDAGGNLASFADPLGHVITYQYDDSDRLAGVTNALGHTKTFAYDGMGKRTARTDASGRTHQFTYDQYGHVSGVQTPAGTTLSFAFNANGVNTRVMDGLGQQTDYTHNQVNELTGVSYAGLAAESFSLDSRDRWTTHTLRNSEEIGYYYDPVGRLILKALPSSEKVHYTYDAEGRLTSVQSDDSSLGYTYDALGRVTQINQDGLIVGYQYDGRWNRTRVTYPDGTWIEKVYSDINQLTAVRDSVGQNIATYTYDDANRPARLALENGTQADFTYNAADRLTQIVNKVTTSDVIISTHGYVLDETGRRQSMTTADGQHSYTYDALYQLVGVDYPSGHPFNDAVYAYDAMWNRVAANEGTSITYSVNALNQYTGVGGTALVYDDLANLTYDGMTTYTWDGENRLVSASVPGHLIAYKYDPFGRRIETDDNGIVTRYVYSGYKVIAEYSGSGVLQAKYVHGRTDDEVLRLDRGGSLYYYHYDGLGSVMALSSESGATVETYRYDVWGNPSGSGSSGNPYRFAGRRYEPATGLYYNRSRYYDPGLGRFLSPDPIGYYGGFNLYAYCQNDPINLIDPYGLKIKYTGTDAEKEKIKKGLEDLKKKSATAKKLIEALEADDDTIKIETTSNGNSYSPGSDTVKYNPDRQNIGTDEPWKTRPPEVGMGHELIHAYHDLNGGIESVRMNEENKTVGIEGYENETYTENGIRDDYGIDKRPRY
ncbi:hypothetical protein HQ520_18065 [bacterium]|nr:hypothetical protein [bacterium]